MTLLQICLLSLAMISATDDCGEETLTATSERLSAGTVTCQQQRITESRQIVSVFRIEFTVPPKRTPGKTSVDGPLLGNGDMGVVFAGSPEAQRFILCKNDMWRLQHGYGNASPVPFGTLSINVPGLNGASYRVVQDLYTATTEGVFERGSSAVTMKSYVVATDNVFVVELTARGKPFEASVSMDVALGRGSDSESFAQGIWFWGRRAFSKDVDIPSGVAAAWTVFDDNTVPVGDSFVLDPGKTMTLVLAMDSLFKHKDYVGAVKTQIRSMDEKRLIDIKAAHTRWWADYYAKSYVNIHDPVIEKMSTVPNTINEMLCMGHKGVLRVFPVWPKSQDATFTDIRCWGAFLVSGELKNGRVTHVTLVSEKGRNCRMVNPWPDQKVGLYREGRLWKHVEGERFTFETRPGTTYQLRGL